MKVRLDIYLTENSDIKSRTQAALLIKSGQVLVNSVPCLKSSAQVDVTDKIEIVGDMPKYVGRGGIKLEKAIQYFGISVQDCICIDIGASTGGFTDCMLQSGARTVYAVDVGINQLDDKLRTDSRVVSMEKTDIRSAADKLPLSDFVSIDVSFISLKQVLPTAYLLLKSCGACVALIKPQFEAGKGNLNKNGIVKDEKVRKRVCEEISAFSKSVGFDVLGLIPSPIKGGDGNTEYLMYMKKS